MKGLGDVCMWTAWPIDRSIDSLSSSVWHIIRTNDAQVDIIISEWMGYFLLYESMLDTGKDAWFWFVDTTAGAGRSSDPTQNPLLNTPSIPTPDNLTPQCSSRATSGWCRAG